MQNEQEILLVITHTEKEYEFVTECYMKNNMNPDEQLSLVQALTKTIEDLINIDVQENTQYILKLIELFKNVT